MSRRRISPLPLHEYERLLAAYTAAAWKQREHAGTVTLPAAEFYEFLEVVAQVSPKDALTYDERMSR